MTGLYFDLIFVLMVVTLISNRNVATGEQIFKDIVNGVKFGELRNYTIIDESVFTRASEILEDKYIPGNVLISTRNNVFTLDYVNRMASLIAGINGGSGYIEGVGASARFEDITGICQIGSDEVIVVDSVLHCLRLINRTTTATRTFAGQCIGGTPNNAFQQTRFRIPRKCVYNSARHEIFIMDTNEVIKLSLAQDNTSRYIPPDRVDHFSALTPDFTSENIYLAAFDSILLKFNIASNQFTTIASSSGAAGDGRLTQAEFGYITTMTFVNNATLIVGQEEGSIKVIDFSDPPSVSSMCEYDSNVATYVEGNIRNCKLSVLMSMAYLPERSALMVCAYELATFDIELVNTPGITAGSTAANRVNSTVNKPRTTAGNTLNTITNGPDSTVVQAFSFGLRTHPSVITLTAMITALVIPT